MSVTGGVTGAEVRRCRAYFPYIHVGPTLQLGSRREPFFSTFVETPPRKRGPDAAAGAVAPDPETPQPKKKKKKKKEEAAKTAAEKQEQEEKDDE